MLITETSLQSLCYFECTENCFGMTSVAETMENSVGHINQLFKAFSFVGALLWQQSHCDGLLNRLH